MDTTKDYPDFSLLASELPFTEEPKQLVAFPYATNDHLKDLWCWVFMPPKPPTNLRGWRRSEESKLAYWLRRELKSGRIVSFPLEHKHSSYPTYCTRPVYAQLITDFNDNSAKSSSLRSRIHSSVWPMPVRYFLTLLKQFLATIEKYSISCWHLYAQSLSHERRPSVLFRRTGEWTHTSIDSPEKLWLTGTPWFPTPPVSSRPLSVDESIDSKSNCTRHMPAGVVKTVVLNAARFHENKKNQIGEHQGDQENED